MVRSVLSPDRGGGDSSDAETGTAALVESLSYASGEWTVAATVRLRSDAPCHQQILARAVWPADEVKSSMNGRVNGEQGLSTCE